MTAPSFENTTALVTGAHGFIGRYVSYAAAQSGYLVSGIGHGSPAPSFNSAWGISRFVNCDVTLESLREHAGQPDLIFHCAGSGSVAQSIADPLGDYRRTADTTAELLEFVRLYSPQSRLIIPSSAGVYGATSIQPISENTTLSPSSPYGVHKKIAEDLARSYAKHFGLRIAMVRLFSVYGETLKKQLLWDACRKLSVGDNIFFGTGFETRDWLHAHDAAALMLAGAVHANEDCPIVNGGSGEAVTIEEVVRIIAEELRASSSPIFNGQVRAGDPLHYQADIGGAMKWGWAPRLHWRDAIPEYVRWFQEERS